MMEISSPTKKFLREINAGITSLVLLSVMNNSGKPMYGYQIAKQIDFGDDKGLSMKQSALYPVLRSLEKHQLLESIVEPSTSGPPRRYYNITKEGRETLIDWKDIWKHVKDTVDEILEGEGND